MPPAAPSDLDAAELAAADFGDAVTSAPLTWAADLGR